MMTPEELEERILHRQNMVRFVRLKNEETGELLDKWRGISGRNAITDNFTFGVDLLIYLVDGDVITNIDICSHWYWDSLSDIGNHLTQINACNGIVDQLSQWKSFLVFLKEKLEFSE